MRKNYFDDLVQATKANAAAINDLSNAFNSFSNATISISDNDIINDYNIYSCTGDISPHSYITNSDTATITINPNGVYVNNSVIATIDEIDKLEERIEKLEAAIHRLKDPFSLDNWDFDFNIDFDFDIDFDFEDTFKWLT